MKVLRRGLDLCQGDLEPGKLHFVASEAEFARVQGYAIGGAEVEPFCGLVECFCDVV